jgi:hypothetical protein
MEQNHETQWKELEQKLSPLDLSNHEQLHDLEFQCLAHHAPRTVPDEARVRSEDQQGL